MITATEKRFGEYHEDNKAVSLRNRSGTCGGGSEVLVVYMQDKTGTLSPGAHAGSYNGQDAYNGMLVDAEDKRIQRVNESVSNEDARLQRLDRPDRGGWTDETS